MYTNKIQQLVFSFFLASSIIFSNCSKENDYHDSHDTSDSNQACCPMLDASISELFFGEHGFLGIHEAIREGIKRYIEHAILNIEKCSETCELTPLETFLLIHVILHKQDWLPEESDGFGNDLDEDSVILFSITFVLSPSDDISVRSFQGKIEDRLYLTVAKHHVPEIIDRASTHIAVVTFSDLRKSGEENIRTNTFVVDLDKVSIPEGVVLPPFHYESLQPIVSDFGTNMEDNADTESINSTEQTK